MIQADTSSAFRYNKVDEYNKIHIEKKKTLNNNSNEKKPLMEYIQL